MVLCEMVGLKWFLLISSMSRSVGLLLPQEFLMDMMFLDSLRIYISVRSKDLFCFLMVVDEISMQFIRENVAIEEDNDGGKWVGIWRLMFY